MLLMVLLIAAHPTRWPGSAHPAQSTFPGNQIPNQTFRQAIGSRPLVRASFIIAALCVAFFAGCVDYGVDSTVVSLDRLPDKTLAALVRSEPSAIIQQVRVQTHRKAVVSYRVQFRRQDGGLFDADFDAKGKRVHYQQSHTLPK